ncbi:MAG: hypothetical protein QF805_23445, partial [Pirellulaceae bacterium]|nr:hypothetical protein [Pirellulaceae bacterium]
MERQQDDPRSSKPTVGKLRPYLPRLLLWASVGLWAGPAEGQIALEKPPINYLKATATDAVAQLQKRIDAGEVELKHDAQHGYLKSVLEHLDVSTTSQTLVFSKTSFQVRHISPQTPRAVYFGDDTYVGWVQDGSLLEISVVDPNLVTNFYSLS